MTDLKKFAELGTVHRIAPCQEYPGTWIVSYPALLSISPDMRCITRTVQRGGVVSEAEEIEHIQNCNCGEKSFPTFLEALAFAHRTLSNAEEEKLEYNPRDITISWKCSDNDPRVGEVWFTGYYIHGKFGGFGNYVAF